MNEQAEKTRPEDQKDPAEKESLPIRVNHPRKLKTWTVPCKRIPLGIPGDYKPSMAMMPDGELVMVALFMEQRDGDKMREWTPIWRSSDGGRTWSERRLLEEVIGREQWLTCSSDGTLFMTSHFLIQDINNHDGYIHSYLHRSSDAGRTWQQQRIHIEGDERRGAPDSCGTHTSRNIIELDDGTLLFGVSIGHGIENQIAYLWSSRDGGKTWDHGKPVEIPNYRGQTLDNWDGFFCEDFTYRTKQGKFLHWIRFGPPSPMYPMDDGRSTPATDDSGDRMLLCESGDLGRMWGDLQDHGDYGLMYPRPLPLKDGRLMLTFTQRGLLYPFGLQAILSGNDGETWDFNSDRIIIAGKTPWGFAQGGGFGNTVQLDDDTLVSCYTYRGPDDQTHLEVVRWALPNGI